MTLCTPAAQGESESAYLQNTLLDLRAFGKTANACSATGSAGIATAQDRDRFPFARRCPPMTQLRVPSSRSGRRRSRPLPLGTIAQAVLRRCIIPALDDYVTTA
jgi:hypothetical protein